MPFTNHLANDKIARNRKPLRSGVPLIKLSDAVLSGGNVSCLQTLGASFYLEIDRLTFCQGLEAIALDRVEMYEYILTTI